MLEVLVFCDGESGESCNCWDMEGSIKLSSGAEVATTGESVRDPFEPTAEEGAENATDIA